MRLSQRLADPWAALVAAVAGGLTWAVLPGTPLGVPIGIGVGVAVFAAKLAGEALLHRGGDGPAGPTELPQPARGSPEGRLAGRVERALDALDATVTSAAPSATREQLRTIAEKAAGTRGAVGRLAGQATAFGQAMDQIAERDLAAERARLTAAIAAAARPEVREEHRAALSGVEQQLAAHQRLAAAREAVLARMESTAAGVEALHARAVELLALAGAAGHTADDEVLEELSGELDALRGGLAEVERLASGTLPQPGDPPA